MTTPTGHVQAVMNEVALHLGRGETARVVAERTDQENPE